MENKMKIVFLKNLNGRFTYLGYIFVKEEKDFVNYKNKKYMINWKNPVYDIKGIPVYYVNYTDGNQITPIVNECSTNPQELDAMIGTDIIKEITKAISRADKKMYLTYI